MTDCLVIFGPLLCLVAAMAVGFGVNHFFAYRESTNDRSQDTGRAE